MTDIRVYERDGLWHWERCRCGIAGGGFGSRAEAVDDYREHEREHRTGIPCDCCRSTLAAGAEVHVTAYGYNLCSYCADPPAGHVEPCNPRCEVLGCDNTAAWFVEGRYRLCDVHYQAGAGERRCSGAMTV